MLNMKATTIIELHPFPGTSIDDGAKEAIQTIQSFEFENIDFIFSFNGCKIKFDKYSDSEFLIKGYYEWVSQSSIGE